MFSRATRAKKFERFARVFYPAYRADWFEALVRSHVGSETAALEIGAGGGGEGQNRFALKGLAASYTGVDIDPRVVANPSLDRGVVADASLLPFEDESFDLVFSHMVVEHVSDAASFLSEQERVLKPGGRALHLTVSKYYWTSLLNVALPQSVTNLLIRTLASGRGAEDVFPTCYALNADAELEAARETIASDLRWEYRFSPPGYLRFSYAAMLAAWTYDNSWARAFPELRPGLLLELRKR